MKSRGIIFSAPMVRANLEGRKFVTRRLNRSWLKYKKGDEIWCRETFILAMEPDEDGNYKVWYKADYPSGTTFGPATSSRFMPRKYSRISHTLTEDARLERLQDITEEEIINEGVNPRNYYYVDDLHFEFIRLWDSLHPKENRWADNPEVIRLSWLPKGKP